MQIDRMYYPTTTLGYGRRLTIWTIGCHRHCQGCSNPELRSQCPDKEVPISELLKPVEALRGKLDGVTITGGEPFDQVDELLPLLFGLRKDKIEDILVYTGYTLSELLCLGTAYTDCVSLIGVLIDGTYRETLNDNRSIRGSSNQVIHVLNQSLEERYVDVLQWPRKSEVINCNGLLISVGIPILT